MPILQNTIEVNFTVMNRILLFFLFFILFTSCATTTATKIPQHFESSTEGMIVGTFAFENEKPIFNQYFYHYQAEGDKKLRQRRMMTIRPHQIWKMKFEPDFADNTKAVYFFSIREVEGKYAFTLLRLHSNRGYIQKMANIPLENLDFTIEKGKIKYIGEIYFNYHQGIISLTDQRERDLPKFKERFPNLTIE